MRNGLAHRRILRKIIIRPNRIQKVFQSSSNLAFLQEISGLFSNPAFLFPQNFPSARRKSKAIAISGRRFAFSSGFYRFTSDCAEDSISGKEENI